MDRTATERTKLSHDDRRWVAVSMARANAGTPFFQIPAALEALAEGLTTPAWAVLEARKIVSGAP